MNQHKNDIAEGRYYVHRTYSEPMPAENELKEPSKSKRNLRS